MGGITNVFLYEDDSFLTETSHRELNSAIGPMARSNQGK